MVTYYFHIPFFKLSSIFAVDGEGVKSFMEQLYEHLFFTWD